MSETVKRYYISAYPGVGTPSLVEMSERYQRETGALGLIKGEDYVRLEQECERLKRDRKACWAEFKVMTRSCLDAEKERDAALKQVEGLLALLHRASKAESRAELIQIIDAALSAKQ